MTVVDHLSLEPYVSDLNSRTRVRAAIDVDRDRHIKRRVDVLEPPLQLGHQTLCPAPGFGERQLAELNPTARHQIPAPMRRARLQTQRLHAGDQIVQLVVGYVED